ncbi:TetR/AcrR family transcriptional regulator [Marisediminicola senii]|uniref:TetR/AcrR family transcriptional regulator n=1 Tax=Marisediminicola senii TaxID=2711233 RepID=UPI0013ED6891|nr:TetR family transcriptional regulator [Marisediminicola senii]
MTGSALIDGGATAAPDLGLRERKRRATAAAIGNATRALAAERGFSHVTVEQVCDAVGISRRTFFNYFPSKEDALLGLHEAGVPEALAARFIDSRVGTPHGEVSPNLMDDLVELSCAVLEEAPLGREEFQLVLAAVRRDPNLLAILVGRAEEREGMLRELIAARESLPPTDVRVVTAAAVMGAVMQQSGREYFGTETPRSYREILVGNVAAARMLLRS